LTHESLYDDEDRRHAEHGMKQQAIAAGLTAENVAFDPKRTCRCAARLTHWAPIKFETGQL
jgi:hypothetical protein